MCCSEISRARETGSTLAEQIHCTKYKGEEINKGSKEKSKIFGAVNLFRQTVIVTMQGLHLG
jgi:hypothetical protein